MKKKLLGFIFFIFTMTVALSFVMLTASADAQEPLTLIDLDTEWKYLDDNTDPSSGLDSLTAWTKEDFDDSGWKRGIGSFGSKGGSLGAVNSETPKVLLELYCDDGTTCIPTYFFRTSFTVTDADKYNTLSFKAYADDALVIYVNGVTVKDSRSTKKTNTNLYYSSGEWEQSFFIDLEALDCIKEGENTVAVQLHNNQKASSDIYFGIHSMSLSYMDPVVIAAESVVLGVGADESCRTLSWISSTKEGVEARLAPKSTVKNGVFPTEYTAFSASTVKCTNLIGRYSNETTLEGLLPDTEYAYTLAAGGEVSKIYYFKTGKSGEFDFAFVGDPQLSSKKHGESWSDTVDKINNNFAPHFIASAGDNVNSPNSEDQYSYFITEALSRTPIAVTVGPSHDSASVSFEDHFCLPNKSDKYGVNTTSANYWYTYNGTLFMHLNMSATKASFNGQHESFMKEAIAANPNAKWKIVIMHISLFSTSEHGNPDGKYFENELGRIRPALAPVFYDLDIDAVLSGHDHVYVRTKMMSGINVSEDLIRADAVYDPEGTLYLCASSSSGSKFYDKQIDADFVEYENYEKRKSAVKVTVKDESLTFTSYFLDTMTVFDSFTIYKEPHTCAPVRVEKVAPTCIAEGKEAYYLCKCGTAYTTSLADEIIADVEGYGIIPVTEHSFAEATCTEPQKCTTQGCIATLGEPLPHTYGRDTERKCSVCGFEREVPRSYKTVIAVSLCAFAVVTAFVGAVIFVIKRRNK